MIARWRHWIENTDLEAGGASLSDNNCEWPATHFLSRTLQFVPVHINYVSLGVTAAGGRRGAEKSYTNQEGGCVWWATAHISRIRERAELMCADCKQKTLMSKIMQCRFSVTRLQSRSIIMTTFTKLKWGYCAFTIHCLSCHICMLKRYLLLTVSEKFDFKTSDMIILLIIVVWLWEQKIFAESGNFFWWANFPRRPWNP